MSILYVNTAGSDITGNGTSSNPYATIGKAVTVSSNGDTIEVAAGNYIENITLNKQVYLIGEDKTTTIIKSLSSATTPTIQIIDGASGTSITNVTVKGKFSTQTTTGSGNASNNDSAILVSGTEINHIILADLIIDQASNGITFNNTHSNNINISGCDIQNNEGAGIRIASNTQTMNGFTVIGCTIQDNNLNAINSNPSGTDRPNCTNFTISNCSIRNNNKLTVNNSHDVSFFGFNGNIEITNTNIHCSHAESKIVNGSSATTGGWGLIIFGTGNGTTTPYKSSGNITMSNVIMTGNVIKSCLGIDRYSTLGTIIMDGVNIKDCQSNKANLSWLQLAIGHKDTTKPFNLGNTHLRTMYTTNIGNVDATQSSFYDITTGSLLTVQYDLLTIVYQIYDKTFNQNLGEVMVVLDSTIISPTVPNSLITALNSEYSTIILIEGEYVINTNLYNSSNYLKKIESLGGKVSIVKV